MSENFNFWKPSRPIPATERVPVTILSGFLGSGKTTLLNHLLGNAGDTRLAVLVNDLGEVNIDATLVKSSLCEVKSPIGGVMELTSGCICCSIQTELMDALLHLYKKRKPSHILIEATGVAEPKAIVESLYARNFEGVRGTDFLRIHNLVTLVDADNLGAHLDLERAASGRRRNHLLESDRRRPIEELLMEQLECADLLILNKCDRVDPSQSERLRACLRGINARAEVLSAEFGRIAPAAIFRMTRFDEDATMTGASWRRLLLGNQMDGDASADAGSVFQSFTPAAQPVTGAGGAKLFGRAAAHHHRDYGLTSLLYRRRRPFDESKFLSTLRLGLPGIVRAKGFYWTERAPDRVGLLSIAGKILRADHICPWWQVAIGKGEATIEAVPEKIRRDWHPELGDRRQELVFIGVDLDSAEVERRLDACLVSDRFTL